MTNRRGRLAIWTRDTRSPEGASRPWSRVLVAFAAVALATFEVAARPPARLQPRPPPCSPVDDQRQVAAAAMIDTGRYSITMVAMGGISGGASARGNLWLSSERPARDSTSAPSRQAVRARPAAPAYGATDVDLAGVGASVPRDSGSHAPDAHSFDPQHPGVLVLRRVDSTHTNAVWQFLIATDRNDQRACKAGDPCSDDIPTHGPGVVLSTHKVDANGFSGSWRAVNTEATHGYFCAAPVHYYSPFQGRSLPQPPPPHGG